MENKTIIQIICETAQLHGERLFVVDDKSEYTYEQGWNRICRIYRRLTELNIKKSDCIMAECTQDADYIFCNFACNLAGAIFVPIEHKASQARVEDIFSETEAVLFVRNSEYDLELKSVTYDEIVGDEAAWVSEFPKLFETAEILYTTGTTGKSKGIEITHENNVALAENIAYGTGMKEGNAELIPLPLSHSHAIRCAYANFFRKGTVIIKDGIMRVKEIYDSIVKYEISAMDLSPTAVSVLLKLSRGKFADFNDQLDYIQIGTAPLPEETKEQMISLFPRVRLYNFYGSTESGRSCALNFNSEDNRKYCVGRPTKNAHFIVVDDSGKEINSSADNTGLLACRGAMNMKGYWKQPKLTDEIMRDGYIYSQDEAYIDEEGRVYVFGRKADIINYKGIKIAPEEIEQVAGAFKGIADCACVPESDPVAGQVPKLYIMVKFPERFDRNELQRYLAKNLDANKLPKIIEFIDEIPRTSNGKLQRNKLTKKNG